MSGIELKPCGGTDASQTNILMPLGKSTVGRGTLLGIADKRVSRNHGIIDVEDGKIKIMPTHTNPTFYQPKEGSKLNPLEKDVWQTLQHGDKVGLTPDQHIFEVIIHDRPINRSTQSLQTSLLESPENSPQKNSVKEGKTESDKKAEGQQNGDDKIADEEENKPKAAETEKKEEKKAETNDSKPDAEEKPKPKEIKDEKDDNMDEDSEDKEDTNGDTDQDKDKVETVKLEDGKEVALPTQKERTLPNWMAKGDTGKEAKEEDEPEDQLAEPIEDEKPVKKGRGRPKGSAKKTKAVKKGRGRPPKRSGDDDEALSPSRIGPSREKRKKYSEDYLDDEEEEEEPKVVFKDDDDWILSEEDEVESEISDWEDSQSQKKAKSKKTPSKRGRKPSRGKAAAKTPTRRGAARGVKQKKAYFTDSEDDYEYDDEIYVPKPTKRTAGRLASSQSSQSQKDEDEYSPKKAATPPKAKKRGAPKKTSKKKKPCEYGSECYRKNPAHFREFSHPDPEEDEYNASGDDEGKEECPYGAECYRTNKTHLKQYRHAPPPPSSRPKREAAQKKAVVIQGDRSSLLHSGVSDDDGAPNTYDDNDSFLDDAIMGSDQEGGKDKAARGSDDSDWSPGADEEAKGAKKTKVH